ncbi:hypothetical protein AGMMS50225_13530 [Betaproteobacteria bacterium]|nr:hypothetical protein AGMMS50225_13530 [Betaproteobacteria bacterium]
MIEPLVADNTGASERAELQAALKKWETRADPLDRTALTDYLAAHPDSPWRAAILGNLGLLALDEGRFSRAVSDLEAAWEAGRETETIEARRFADRIGGELVKLSAQLGHLDAVNMLLPELEARGLGGAGEAALNIAREGQWRMTNPDGLSFMCGPLALEQLRATPRDLFKLAQSGNFPTQNRGYTLTELATLAQHQDQPLVAIHRPVGSAVPVPAIVHWKSGHYSALLEARQAQGGKRYRVRDAALGREYWIHQAALDEEASGYFLSERTAPGWRAVSAEEGTNILGAGTTETNDNTQTQDQSCAINWGMMGVQVNPMLVGLSIKDTPLSYRPPRGPAVPLGIRYSQLEAYQPAIFTYSNLGPNWTFEGITYIVDHPGSPGAEVQRYLPGGGTRKLSAYIDASGEFAHDELDQSKLVLVSTEPITYERHLADGGKEIYREAQTSGTIRKVFISAAIDAAGNTLTYQYERLPVAVFRADAQTQSGTVITMHPHNSDGDLYMEQIEGLRLVSMTDASGAITRLEYHPEMRLVITAIVDPFGRRAQILYDKVRRLERIIDAVGLTSQVVYDTPYIPPPIYIGTGGTTYSHAGGSASSGSGGGASYISGGSHPYSGFGGGGVSRQGLPKAATIGPPPTWSYLSSIAGLITPYGTTKFSHSGAGTTRALSITDARGHISHTVTRHNAPGVSLSEAEQPEGVALVNTNLNLRNTYHWNARTVARGLSGNYNNAQIWHWAHQSGPVSATSGTLESQKRPLESRLWYTYPGQSSATYSGTCEKPATLSRVLPDGSTQLSQWEYNAWGHPTRYIDPEGRETRYEYAANEIDLIKVQQKGATTWETLVEVTWNEQHRPLTLKDAAGKLTRYTWNETGELTSQTNALNQTTHYQYDAQGRLTRIINPLGNIAATYTHDAWGKLATATDAEGYTLGYTYDALGRPTQITYPDGTTTEYTWNKLDVAQVKDRHGKLTTYQYDATRNLIQMTDALRTTRYTYDEDGELVSLSQWGNSADAIQVYLYSSAHATRWERDLQGRVISKQTADGGTTRWDYDSAGREHKRTDAAHRTRTLGYAKDNRLTDIHYGLEIDLPVLDVPDWNKPVLPLPQATAVHFDWDTYYPRLSAMTDPTGATQYRYQQIGAAGALRLQSIDAPGNNNTVQLSYDPLGRVVSQNVNGAGQTYAYDPLSRIIQTKNTQLGTFKYSYLGDTGQLTDALLSGSPIQRGYAYEPDTGDRRLSNILNPSAARSYTYQTAPENLIMGLTETAASQSKTWAYAYDALDRLQTATRDDGAHYGYTLDVADNIQSITDPEGTWTYTHDNANKFDQAPYRYDALGNLIEDEAHTYQWDMENRLTGIGYKTEPQRYSEFRYDGQGRRIAAIETSGTSQTETRYTWCGDVICQTRDGNDKPTNYYYGEGSFRQTGTSATAGEKRYYAKDHLGSVRDVLTQTGTQIASYDYDPYGSLINNPGTAPEFGYAGMQYHAPSGLYLTKYRAYDPRTGRWLSRDPIGEAGGLNLYGYVGGNPVSFFDPLGLAPGQIFGSPDAAAIDAVDWAYLHKDSVDHEYGGWIYPVDGGYTYNAKRGNERFVDVWQLIPDMKKNGQCPEAGWHIHPNVPDKRSEQFSGYDEKKNPDKEPEDDILFAQQSRVPQYLGTYLRAVYRISVRSDGGVSGPTTVRPPDTTRRVW